LALAIAMNSCVKANDEIGVLKIGGVNSLVMIFSLSADCIEPKRVESYNFGLDFRPQTLELICMNLSKGKLHCNTGFWEGFNMFLVLTF
jgi:hypothetical protein